MSLVVDRPPCRPSWAGAADRSRLALLAALAVGLAGCLAPAPAPAPEPRFEPVLGEWESREEGVWIHKGSGEGILLLPGSGERQLGVRLYPTRNCTGLGILAGYQAPDRTQGLLLQDGLDPKLVYFRREGALLLEPPGAQTQLPREAWTSGLLLEATAWPGALQGQLPEAGRSVLWHTLGWTGGRLGLFARGEALFRIVASRPPAVPPPPFSSEGLLARIVPPQGSEAHLGRHLASGLEALADPGAGPRELLAAWLWTGQGVYRARARAWADRAAAAPEDPSMLEGLLGTSHLLGAPGQEALERTVRAALQEQGPLPEESAALLAWLSKGRALLEVERRLRGPLRETVHQAHRAALNRLVRALQPWQGSLQQAGTWETEDLLAAAEWLWAAAPMRADAAKLLEGLCLFLEERRLGWHSGRLVLQDASGAPRPDLALRHALLLARRGLLSGEVAALRLAEAIALGAAPGPFTAARDLAAALPHLAPPGTLALVASSSAVLSIHKEPGALAWTTEGPSTETVLVQVPGLLLETDGQQRPAQGPRIQVTHRQGAARLAREQALPRSAPRDR